MNNLMRCAYLAVGLAVCISAGAAEPNWIWSPETGKQAEPAGACYFRKLIDIAEPVSGTVEITCDNSYRLYVNGRLVGTGDNWQQINRYDVAKQLTPGRNLIAVEGTNRGGPAGLVVRVTAQTRGGKPSVFPSDGSWKTSVRQQGGWQKVKFDDSRWKPAHVYGELGKTAPWGGGRTNVVTKKISEPVKKLPAVERPPGPFQLVDGDRVVLLGDTLIERAGRYGYVETALTTRFPKRNIIFRNLGWSGDNVFARSRAGFGTARDGFRNLQKHLERLQPTVILLSYGANESYAGKAGLETFLRGLENMLAMLDETNAEIVFLTPLKQEPAAGVPAPLERINANRRLYAEAILKVAKQRSAASVDLYNLLGKADNKARNRLTDNGIHLTPYGYSIAADVLQQQLAAGRAKWKVTLSVDSKTAIVAASGARVTGLAAGKTGIRMNILDAFLPPAQAEDRILHVKPRTLSIAGLDAGEYELKVDGKSVAKASASQWAEGVALTQGPQFRQVEQLRQTIRDKNELYFYRWRPQNNTYLFLFRKHEQGNNAVEIPQFDPLVEAKEKEIARLRVPVVHKFELSALQ